MSIIQDIIKALKADTTINTFFTTHYAKNPKHYLGYRRSPIPEELPALCYIPVKSTLDNLTPSFWTISIILMLDDDRLLDENLNEIASSSVVSGESQLFSGAVQSEAITALLTNVLSDLELANAVIKPTFKVTNDMTLNYPFFETEISFEVTALNYYD